MATRSPGGGPARRTRRVALCGIFSALAVVMLLLGGLLPFCTFTAPALAALCLVPLVAEFGAGPAFLAYMSVSAIGLLLVPDLEISLLFVLLIGHYPILQPYIQKLPGAPLRFAARSLLYYAAVALTYSLILRVFAAPALQEEFASYTWWFMLLLLGMGHICFLLYDMLVVRAAAAYAARFAGKFFK